MHCFLCICSERNVIMNWQNYRPVYYMHPIFTAHFGKKKVWIVVEVLQYNLQLNTLRAVNVGNTQYYLHSSFS